MEKQTKTFRSWYDSLTLNEKKVFRAKFLSTTGLSHPGLYTKLRRGNFTPLEQNVVVEYAGLEIIFETVKNLN